AQFVDHRALVGKQRIKVPSLRSGSGFANVKLMPSEFVHLHLHTEYSLLDGANRIPEVMQKAKDFGMPAVGMTDHGNLFGAIEFFQEAKKAGIKPIIGCEVYMAPGLHTDRGATNGR